LSEIRVEPNTLSTIIDIHHPNRVFLIILVDTRRSSILTSRGAHGLIPDVLHHVSNHPTANRLCRIQRRIRTMEMGFGVFAKETSNATN
jgi:hypothetical protein